MRQEYLNYLAEPIENWEGKIKPRVRHPLKWEKVESKSLTGVYVDIEKAMKEGRNVWIWSDHHFFHKNVIDFCNRPYKDVEEMNAEMIKTYKKYVKKGDICIWAGDVTFKGNTVFNEDIYPHFKDGYNILVIGNHDFMNKNVRNLNFDENHLIITLNYKNKKVAITHIPFETKDNNFINVHGHIHDKESEFNHQINVSIEALDFKPVLLQDILEKHLK